MGDKRIFEKLERVNAEKNKVVFKLEYKGKVIQQSDIEVMDYSQEIIDDGDLSLFYFFKDMANKLEDKIQEIIGFNELTFVMDYGESESVILYKELHADFLLIDDRKARNIAENLGVNCIGTIGLLAVAKDKKLIVELKPMFEIFLHNKRYYSIDLLNTILTKYNEEKIIYKA